MPQAANIVINNGAATPVAKTFTLLAPAAGYGSVAEWALKEGTISAMFPRLTASQDKSKGAVKAHVTRIKLAHPYGYTDSTSGQPVVLGNAFGETKLWFPADFPENLKNDVIAFHANALDDAVIRGMSRDGAPAT